MKVAYCINIWTHYQDSFCREMAAILGNDFKMVLFTPLNELRSFNGEGDNRSKQPWVSPAPKEDWIIQPPQTASEHIGGKWNQLLEDADIAIVGYCGHMSYEVLQNRERLKKKTFFMGERLHKIPRRVRDYFNPCILKRWFWQHMLLRGEYTSYLTISHYGVEDLKFLRVCKNRIYQWGYFPATSLEYSGKQRHNKLRIGWCGRMIDWKHVEYIIKAVGRLPPEIQSVCEVILVGEGPEKEKLVELSRTLGVEKVIKFETYKPVRENMEFMRSLDVYIFPSDRGEGWGVALMEAMDKGCVPIANAAAGATLELVESGCNGFVFQDGDIDAISGYLQTIIANPDLCKSMSVAAWHKMQDWSPRTAALRLMEILDKNHIPEEGIGRLRG